MEASMEMDYNMANLVDRLISVSDFNKGKVTHVFEDIKKNNSEYIILKNNQPAAVLISVEDYKRIKRLEEFYNRINNQLLYEQAVDIQSKSDDSRMLSNEEILMKFNISPEEIEKAEERVEIE